MRLLKDLEFHKWAQKNGVSDAMLRTAASEVEDGLVEARLGGHLLKKRVRAPGRGKSGSYRTILAHRAGQRLIFLHGFEKKEKDNISKVERDALLKLGDTYMGYSDAKISKILKDGALIEVNQDEQNSPKRS